MAREYRLRRRAEQQEQTRRRIVEAAVELHGKLGPARTTVSAIAERAGVQRHTYYRHFPDDRSLMMACSGLYLEREPLPDPEPWRRISDPGRRLRRGLGELYEYFERNEELIANVTRDAEIDPLTREINALRMGPPLGAIRGVLAEGLARGARRAQVLAALDLAIDFRTWRSLVRGSGLTRAQAVELVASMLTCAGR